MPDQVQDPPGAAGRRQQGHPQHHVGELPDRRVGEDPLQAVQAQREQRRDQDGHRRHHQGERAQTQVAGQVGAEDVEHDPHDAEHADVHDGDSVQQGTDRHRRHHRGRQPRVQGH